MKEIEGDPAYPIFSFACRWSQDDESKDHNKNWSKGLPEGRIWNSTGNSKIFKTYPTEKELEEILELVDDQIKNNPKYKNIDDYTSSIKFKHFETWHLNWFCHETFRDGFISQAEGFEIVYKNILQSFERYVNRNEILMEQSIMEDPNGFGTITLMGAEDRWRWRGENDGDPPPCRCNGCTSSSMIRINH